MDTLCTKRQLVHWGNRGKAKCNIRQKTGPNKAEYRFQTVFTCFFLQIEQHAYISVFDVPVTCGTYIFCVTWKKLNIPPTGNTKLKRNFTIRLNFIVKIAHWYDNLLNFRNFWNVNRLIGYSANFSMLHNLDSWFYTFLEIKIILKL